MKTTLESFLSENNSVCVRDPKKLKETILAVAYAMIEVSRLIKEMPFRDLGDYKSQTNVQGEQTQWLDTASNEAFKKILIERGAAGLLVSEEEEASCATNIKNAEFVLAYDPLDGSSNLGMNVPVGSIFAIWQRQNINVPLGDGEFFREGQEIVAAGYSVYGPNTLLVLSTGIGVHEFTLDEAKDEFVLTTRDIKIPESGKIYSVNEGNSWTWDEQTKNFVSLCKSKNESLGMPIGARYIGSLVADFHRNLKKGGIFLYPSDSKNPKGKLRMLYECLPMAYIARHAGGKATNGSKDLLTVSPSSIHERCPLIVGSTKLIDLYLNPKSV